MNSAETKKKYGMFLGGLICTALGISLITKAGLGTSPVTSPAYVLTFLLPYSLGSFTMVMNTVMFLLQAVILEKRFQKIQLLQLPAALVFSACIDGWMWALSFFGAEHYVQQILVLLAGCGFMGFGIALEVLPDVLILPGEGLVRAISIRTGWEFGTVKTWFDLSLVAGAALISLAFKGQVLGIREGTVAAALLIGTCSRFFINRLSPWMKTGEEPCSATDPAAAEGSVGERSDTVTG